MNREKGELTDQSQGAKYLIKAVHATALELKQLLRIWTATANQGVKISVANTGLEAETEKFSSRGGFFSLAPQEGSAQL